MKELELKYGCNPNQKPAKVFMEEGELPFQVLNGRPGYINLLDAMNSWQLVRELKKATGLPAAASFKHVSPAGAAVAVPLSNVLQKVYFVEGVELSPVATAYIRARGADRMSSYGDFVALSDECDAQTASFLKREVSDGIIAPSYSAEALEILKTKRKGSYLVIQMDPAYEPPAVETKQVFGVTFSQKRNDVAITEDCLKDIATKAKDLPSAAKRDLLIALITLKYTQSNSVCYTYDGQAIGIGAGQQSRVHCTRLAGGKADRWFLRQSPQQRDRRLHRRRVGRPAGDGRLEARLHGEAARVYGRGEEGVAEEGGARRLPRFGCVLPVRRQYRARAQVRRAVRRADGRLDPRRQCHRDGRQVRHDDGDDAYSFVPSLIHSKAYKNSAPDWRGVFVFRTLSSTFRGRGCRFFACRRGRSACLRGGRG